MKKIIVFFYLLCYISVVSAQKNLFRYSGNDIIPAEQSYMYAAESVYGEIDEAIQHPAVKYPFWIDKALKHDAANYKLIDSINIITESKFLYEIRISQNKNEDESDLATWGKENIFSRLEIVCKNPFFDNNGKINYELEGEPLVFYNDGLWFRFYYFCLSPLTDNPKKVEDAANTFCKKIKLAEDCYAITFRGYRDSIDGTGLAVFVLYKGQAQLVYYNRSIDINEIKEEGDKTTFVLQTPKYDDNGKIIPVISKMTFANGMISLEE